MSDDESAEPALPTDTDLERHPTMHRTHTLGCFVVVRAEVYLVSDTDQILLRAVDTAVVQGGNHAWSNWHGLRF